MFSSSCWKRFWWTKDEEKVATIKTNSLGTVEKYLWSTCSISSCCHQQVLQLQFPWTAVVANGSEGSGSLPSVLQHQYCCAWPLLQVLKVGGWCSWPCHRSSVLSAPICKNKMSFDQSKFKKAVPIWGRDSSALHCHLSQPGLVPYGTGKQPV